MLKKQQQAESMDHVMGIRVKIEQGGKGTGLGRAGTGLVKIHKYVLDFAR